MLGKQENIAKLQATDKTVMELLAISATFFQFE